MNTSKPEVITICIDDWKQPIFEEALNEKFNPPAWKHSDVTWKVSPGATPTTRNIAVSFSVQHRSNSHHVATLCKRCTKKAIALKQTLTDQGIDVKDSNQRFHES